jgi:hypothetical protein
MFKMNPIRFGMTIVFGLPLTMVPTGALLAADTGDAPGSYGLASHEVVSGAPQLGMLPAADNDPVNSALADADTPDEDGVFEHPQLVQNGKAYDTTVLLSNPSSSPANLVGWVDFDGNGVVDAADVDHMCSALGNGNVGSEYDLNGDGTIDAADGQYMITDVMGLLLGDADLNGDVDVSDFNAWNANKFTSGACHADGDFNFDGNVDVGDFNLWNTNKFTSAARDSATSPTVVDEEVSLNRTKPAIDISRVTFATVQEEDESDARDRRTSMFDSSSNHEESVDSFYSEF